ncbi:MAG: amidohydrolase [Gemmatimonadetes bacterium]|nr:amidohydrolase [Vicinamibacterales bacterium]MCH2472471.1 amidohydrolase [Gemmatimonadota bacterium]RUA03998.1 MAG: amidohydrolase [Candidatus Neomarinimicrobiota bacterium]
MTAIRSAVPGIVGVVAIVATLTGVAAQQPPQPVVATTPALDADPRLDDFKQEVTVDIEARRDFTQQMVDSIFSFSELGFQEFETQRYVTDILEAHGFAVERGVAGIPTAWVARWGSGTPVIALGTDIDGIPQASQKPGVAYRDPLVEGAPGHGEGHNSGQALIVTAALAVKKIMERENIPGTLMLWPGVAEEQLGGKAHFVRAGVFEDVDAVLYCHVGTGLSTSWGQGGGSGLVSVEFLFEGESAHGAVSPWDGRSALDGVELMNVGWNYRREHLELQQRSHYVVTDGGDQPNVVPPTAAVWYFFREVTYERIKSLWNIGEQIAAGAALMTGTEVRSRVLGAAYPMHSNKTLAEAMHANIQQVGMPEWSDADQRMARAVQRMLGTEESGLSTELDEELRGREATPVREQRGGYSDDIGDIMWKVPTVTLGFPANISGGQGHNWNKAIAMATPIAHKGATAGAKVHAMTVLDLLLTPSVLEGAWDYFNNVQTKDQQYVSLLRPQDEPAIWLNKEIMERFKPELQQYYYDPSTYDSYLEQLGIEYPTTRE